MRERLPNRRPCARFEFEHGPLRYTADIGYYVDGRVGEVFLTCGRSGCDVDIAVKDSAVALSLALQHGCLVEDIAPSFLHDATGRPEGVLGTLTALLAAEGSSA